MSNVISTAVSKTLNVVLAQGSAVFNNADNSITLTGIGKDIEIGDVIQVIGAPSNSKEFTLEEIVSTGKIIVNKAHAGGTTSKSLVSETAEVTVKLLCKWYLAPIGLGQGWVDVLGQRDLGEPYDNDTKRSIGVSIHARGTTVDGLRIFLESNGVTVSFGSVEGSGYGPTLYSEIPSGTYRLADDGLGVYSGQVWAERR